MSGSLNKVHLIGNLGKDPEIWHTQDGRAIANFSIATSEHWRDKDSGERREKTEWHRVAVFNEPLVKIVEQYLKKGSKVWVEGKLQTNKWKDKEGVDRYTTQIVLQGFNCGLTILSSPSTQPADAGAPADDGFGDPKPRKTSREALDDEIPF